MSDGHAEWRERAAEYRREGHAAIDKAHTAKTIDHKAELLRVATEFFAIADELEDWVSKRPKLA